MSARADVLGAIRRSIGVTGDEAPRRMGVEDRIERAPPGIIPQRGQVEGQERLSLFVRMAEAAQASVAVLDASADVPKAVADYLRQHNLPATIRMGTDERLARLPWDTTSLEISHGKSDGRDLNGLSHAFGAAAETGTLVLASGQDNPTTLNFLPDNHLVVLAEKDIAGDYEDIWRRLRFAYGKAEMPRTVNFITGPSRSADIEQTLLLGAHGPRRLHILVVRG